MSSYEIDYVALGQPTGPYSYRDFDPEGGVKHLCLTGYSIDGGIDTNSNGLFDQLVVNTEVAVTIAGSYTWSARLVDANGIDLGFYSATYPLNTGNQILFFVFNGKAIGSNGVDGPYFVKGLTMYGPSNANLVVIDMAETSFYKADEFEGYVGPVDPVEPKIGDLNGDNYPDTGGRSLQDEIR